MPLDSLAYRFDIVLRGQRATLFENRVQRTPSASKSNGARGRKAGAGAQR